MSAGDGGDQSDPVSRLRYIARSTKSLLGWFDQSISSRKSQIRETLAAADGDEDALKKDIFTRITLASLKDGRYHLEDSEIVCNSVLNLYTRTDI